MPKTDLFLSQMAILHAGLFKLNERIRDGDDEALFDFVKVDKTIVSHRFVRERIRIAQLSGNSEFFRNLGNALKWDPRKREFKVHKRNFLLRMIALSATKHLTMKEICDILDQVCGIYEDDVETVRKAWNRAKLNEILPKPTSDS